MARREQLITDAWTPAMLADAERMVTVEGLAPVVIAGRLGGVVSVDAIRRKAKSWSKAHGAPRAANDGNLLTAVKAAQLRRDAVADLPDPVWEYPENVRSKILPDRKHGECKWPVGRCDPTRMDKHLFCCMPVERPGANYCPHHADIAHGRKSAVATITATKAPALVSESSLDKAGVGGGGLIKGESSGELSAAMEYVQRRIHDAYAVPAALISSGPTYHPVGRPVA